MDSLRQQKLQYLALGGACAAAAASLAYCRCCDEARKTEQRNAQASQGSSKAPAPQRPVTAPKAALAKRPSQSPITPKAAQSRSCSPKSFHELKDWAAGLKKRDSAELPVLLVSVEKLLQEEPDHEALQTCLKALCQMVAGHQEGERVSAIAVKAGARYPEQALEVLNALFKDRRQRGGFVADPEVVDFTLEILRSSLKGGVERGTYQRATRLLDWLVNDAENRTLIESRGGFETLLHVMEKFDDFPGVLLEGCGCLQHLAAEPSLDVDRAVAIAVSCLEKFSQNPELQWRAMAVLQMLPLPDTELRLHVAKLACAAAKSFPRCDTPTTVVEWTAKLLHKLAKDRNSDVLTWLKDPAQKPWLEWFKEVPHASARGKVNQDAEHWSRELCRLCRV